jgi:hypothetical protein
MASARAADEPAAKMAKKEQQDYTLTHPEKFQIFKYMYSGVLLYPPIVIDGLEVIPKLQIFKGRFVVEFISTKECRNGLMFPKHCGDNAYEFFQIDFDTVYACLLDFNKFMAFIHEEVPHMKIYGNKLVLAKDFDAKTAQEEELYAANPELDRCGQCGQINYGSLMTVCATSGGMDSPVRGACLKCYLRYRYTQFDTDVENHVLVYDHNKVEFDVGGSCKFAERVEGGLISIYNDYCLANHEDEDEED